MQKSIDELSQKIEAISSASRNAQAPGASGDRETRGICALLEEKLAKQQSQLEGQTKMLQQHTGQLQELFAKNGTTASVRSAPGAGGGSPSDSLAGNAESRLKEVEDMQGQQVQ